MNIKNRLFLLQLFLTFAMLTGINQAMAEPRDKVDICHLNEDTGLWELININGNAVGKHLENHDDGLPDTTTTQSGTNLNNSCEEILPACGNCLEERSETGCEQADCEAIVSGLDGFCILTAWDSQCVDKAEQYCVNVVCSAN